MPSLRSTVIAFIGFPFASAVLADDTEAMGYNPYRKKVVKPGDKWIFAAIALVAVGLILWGFLG
jgi:hypothetical protein